MWESTNAMGDEIQQVCVVRCINTAGVLGKISCIPRHTTNLISDGKFKGGATHCAKKRL